MSRNREKYEQRKEHFAQLQNLKQEFHEKLGVVVNCVMRDTAEKLQAANNNPWVLRSIQQDYIKQLEDIRQEFEPFEQNLDTQIELVGNEICYLCWEWMDDIRNQQEQDAWEREIWRQELETEAEYSSYLNLEVRVKSKAPKKVKKSDQKTIVSLLSGDKQNVDKLSRSKIEEALRRRAKPKSKNISRV
jgi:hypothetical protein